MFACGLWAGLQVCFSAPVGAGLLGRRPMATDPLLHIHAYGSWDQPREQALSYRARSPSGRSALVSTRTYEGGRGLEQLQFLLEEMTQITMVYKEALPGRMRSSDEEPAPRAQRAAGERLAAGRHWPAAGSAELFSLIFRAHLYTLARATARACACT